MKHAQPRNRIDNLIVIVDSNKVQLDGDVDEIPDTGDLRQNSEPGFHVIS